MDRKTSSDIREIVTEFRGQPLQLIGSPYFDPLPLEQADLLRRAYDVVVNPVLARALVRRAERGAKRTGKPLDAVLEVLLATWEKDQEEGTAHRGWSEAAKKVGEMMLERAKKDIDPVRDHAFIEQYNDPLKGNP